MRPPRIQTSLAVLAAASASIVSAGSVDSQLPSYSAAALDQTYLKEAPHSAQDILGNPHATMLELAQGSDKEVVVGQEPLQTYTAYHPGASYHVPSSAAAPPTAIMMSSPPPTAPPFVLPYNPADPVPYNPYDLAHVPVVHQRRAYPVSRSAENSLRESARAPAQAMPRRASADAAIPAIPQEPSSFFPTEAHDVIFRTWPKAGGRKEYMPNMSAQDHEFLRRYVIKLGDMPQQRQFMHALNEQINETVRNDNSFGKFYFGEHRDMGLEHDPVLINGIWPRMPQYQVSSFLLADLPDDEPEFQKRPQTTPEIPREPVTPVDVPQRWEQPEMGGSAPKRMFRALKHQFKKLASTPLVVSGENDNDDDTEELVVVQAPPVSNLQRTPLHRVGSEESIVDMYALRRGPLIVANPDLDGQSSSGAHEDHFPSEEDVPELDSDCASSEACTPVESRAPERTFSARTHDMPAQLMPGPPHTSKIRMHPLPAPLVSGPPRTVWQQQRHHNPPISSIASSMPPAAVPSPSAPYPIYRHERNPAPAESSPPVSDLPRAIPRHTPTPPYPSGSRLTPPFTVTPSPAASGPLRPPSNPPRTMPRHTPTPPYPQGSRLTPPLTVAPTPAALRALPRQALRQAPPRTSPTPPLPPKTPLPRGQAPPTPPATPPRPPQQLTPQEEALAKFDAEEQRRAFEELVEQQRAEEASASYAQALIAEEARLRRQEEAELEKQRLELLQEEEKEKERQEYARQAARQAEHADLVRLRMEETIRARDERLEQDALERAGLEAARALQEEMEEAEHREREEQMRRDEDEAKTLEFLDQLRANGDI